jgi:hypothetical protein
MSPRLHMLALALILGVSSSCATSAPQFQIDSQPAYVSGLSARQCVDAQEMSAPEGANAQAAIAPESTGANSDSNAPSPSSTGAGAWNGMLVTEKSLSFGPPPPPPSSAPVAAPSDGSSRTYPGAGSWEFSLGGSGSADKHFDDGGFALAASLGYYLSDMFEVVARQNASLSDFGSSIFQGQTRVALDLNLGDGPVRPVIGGNIGYVYGDEVRDTWSAAPEAGLKIYLQKNVFLLFMGEYQFFFEKANQADDAFHDGAFLFEVGLGMSF